MITDPLGLANPFGVDWRGALTKRLTLEQMRRRQALTQTELARKAQVSPSLVSCIEHGKRPGMKTIRALAKALEVEPTDIDWPGDPLGLGSGK